MTRATILKAAVFLGLLLLLWLTAACWPLADVLIDDSTVHQDSTVVDTVYVPCHAHHSCRR